MMKFRAVAGLFCFLVCFFSSIGSSAPLRAREIYTDLMLDDILATVVYADKYRATRGRGLLFVTCGGDTLEKARALHNLLFLLGIPEAQVVAGSPGPETPDVGYVADYTKDGGQEAFIKALSGFRGPTKFKNLDFRRETKRFRAAYGKTRPVFLASPYTFEQTISDEDATHFDEFFLGAWWKYDPQIEFPSPGISAFNMNDSRAAAVEVLDFAARHKINVRSLPSHLVQTSPDLAQALREPQRRLMENPAHDGLMRAVKEGMKKYRDELANILVKNYGWLAKFVTLWDPDLETWVQDTLIALADLDPDLVSGWTNVRVAIGEALHDNGLGFPVTFTMFPGSNLLEATSLNHEHLLKIAPTPFSSIVLTPDFKPSEVINRHDRTPIAVVTKTSIDDIGAIRMLLGLGDRLKLLITESTHTPTLTAILKKLVAGFKKSKQVDVVTGVGDSDERMGEVPSLNVVERALLKTKLLGKFVLSPEELEALSQVDATSANAEDELIALLNANPKVDLVVTTSQRTVRNVLERRPDLASHIRTLHLMAGVRGQKSAEGETGGWTDGSPTRNTEIDIESAQFLTEFAQKNKIETYYYSSHLAGGMLTPDSFQLSIPVWKKLREKYPSEQWIHQLQLNWNDGLVASGRMVDRETNFGPPLSWLMAAMVALGSDGRKYFSTTRGTLTFRDGKIDFTPDLQGTVQVLNSQSTMLYLDQIAAYLSEKAHSERSGFNRIVKSCSEWVRGKLGGTRE